MARGHITVQSRDNILMFVGELRSVAEQIASIASAMKSLHIDSIEIREGHAMAMKAVGQTFPAYFAQLKRGLIEAMSKQNRFGGGDETHTTNHGDRDPGN